MTTPIKTAFLLMFFFLLIPRQSYSQLIVYGNSSDVIKARINNELNNAVSAISSGIKAKLAFESEMNSVRIQFWSSVSLGQPSKELVDQYIQLLSQKDYYIFLIKATTRWSEARTGKPSPIPDVYKLMGGDPDGGISPFAEEEFDYWAGTVINDWFRLMENSFDFVALRTAMNQNTDLYLNYVRKRDDAEYFFKNPYSPLRSNDSEKYTTAVLQLGGACEDLEDCTRYYKDMKRFITKEQLEQGLADFRKDDFNSSLSNLEKHSDCSNVSYFVASLEWQLAKYSPYTYGLSLIKRQYLCDWDLAKQIYDNRVKRYGQQQVEEALAKVYSYAENMDSICIGDPSKFNSYSRMYPSNVTQQELYFQRGLLSDYGENCDCLREIFGDEMTWEDLKALGKSLDYLQYKTPFLKFLREEMNAQEYKDKTPEKWYADLVKVVDEKLFLQTFHLYQKLGVNLLAAQGSASYGCIGKRELLISRRDGIEPVLRLFEGLLSVSPDQNSIIITYLRYKNAQDNQFAGLDKALSEYQKMMTLEEKLIEEAYRFAVEKVQKLGERENQRKIGSVSTPLRPSPFFKRNGYELAIVNNMQNYLDQYDPEKISEKRNAKSKAESLKMKFDKWIAEYDPSQYPVEPPHLRKFPDAPKYDWANSFRGRILSSITHFDEQIIFENEEFTVYLTYITYEPQLDENNHFSFNYSLYIEMNNVAADQEIYDPDHFHVLVANFLIPIINRLFGDNSVQEYEQSNGRRSSNLFCNLGVKGYHRKKDKLLSDAEWKAIVEEGRREFEESLNKNYYKTPSELYNGWLNKVPSRSGIVAGSVYKAEDSDQFALWLGYESRNNSIKAFLGQ